MHLDAGLNFPHVGQAFLIEREVIPRKARKQTLDYRRLASDGIAAAR